MEEKGKRSSNHIILDAQAELEIRTDDEIALR